MVNVAVLDLVSLFTDISMDMMVAVLPLFPVFELGASSAISGTIEVAMAILAVATLAAVR